MKKNNKYCSVGNYVIQHRNERNGKRRKIPRD